MVKDITIGQFFPGNSFIHKLDARAKILTCFALIIFIFICKNFVSMGLMLLFVALVYALTRLSPKLMIKSLKPLLPIILLTSVLQLYYNNNGDVLWSYKKLSITDGGIYMAIFIAVRIITLLVISSLLTYTTSPTDLTDAIERLLSPLKVFKVDIHTFAMMMTIALRFIPTLIDEIDRIMSAQKARGADFESGNLLKRIKALFPIFIPLIISSFKRAFELADAMSCRCYVGGKGRTRMRKMEFTYRDAVASVITVIICGAIIFMNFQFEALI
ncbi:MAG: energy-coupling factor transporter transmembrane protein EcfT [Ruminococcaceae bacterium]|nr:energy-coupling factor transporter transmembrane protein EcfT [Oscillospiraceae bacterium]